MIDRNHALPIKRQAELVGISRGDVYYLPRAASPADQRLMKRIDVLNLERPFAGSRMLRDMLNREGFEVGRRHVATLMRRMGIEALYRKPNTSRKHPGHHVYPYLLRELKIERANQVWASDITYIPMACGWVYLCMDASFCVEALQEALAKYGQPEIFNSDQGSQFTADAFTEPLKALGVQISMDGRGAWRDNVFVERLWKSVKYEEVYLHAYDSVAQAKVGLARYFDFYNSARPHSSLDKKTPDEFYFATLPAIQQAA
jgi:putative transposase